MRTEKVSYQARELFFFFTPNMSPVNGFPPARNLADLSRVVEHVFDLSRQVDGISQLEKHKGVLVEVVRNSGGTGRNSRLAQSQILENPRRGVQFCKNVA